MRTFDDLVDLLEQLDSAPAAVIVQADNGMAGALRICRVIMKHTKAGVHLVGQGITEADANASRMLGVASVHEAGSEIAGLYENFGSRANPAGTGRMKVGTLTIDRGRRSVTVRETRIALTRTEFAILWLLVSHPGETVTRSQLIDHVWGQNWFGAPNVLDTHVAHLRAKFARTGHRDALVNVHGVGFYFEPNFSDDVVAHPEPLASERPLSGHCSQG